MGVSVEHEDPFWSRLVDEVASRVADQLATEVQRLLTETRGSGPWLTTAQAIKYTGLPDGTFRKLAACGKIPSHGGRSKIFYRPEIDQALLSSAGLYRGRSSVERASGRWPRKAKLVRSRAGAVSVRRRVVGLRDPKGQRTAQWLKLGDVGVQEARRLRDEFAYRLNTGQASTACAPAHRPRSAGRLVRSSGRASRRPTSCVRAPSPPTRTASAFTSRPCSAAASSDRSRRMTSSTGTRPSAAPAPRPGPIRARWMGVRGLFGYAARTGLIATNPCDLLDASRASKTGKSQAALSHHRRRSGPSCDRASGEGLDRRPAAAVLGPAGVRGARARRGATSTSLRQVMRVRHQMSRKGERYRSRPTPDAGTSSSWTNWRSACASVGSPPASHSDDDLVLGNGRRQNAWATPGCSEPSQMPPKPPSCAASRRTHAATHSPAS